MVQSYKLSKKSANLVCDFEAAAKNHGWQEDQGTGPKVQQAADLHEKYKEKLLKHLLLLEKQVRNLRAREKYHGLQ